MLSNRHDILLKAEPTGVCKDCIHKARILKGDQGNPGAVEWWCKIIPGFRVGTCGLSQKNDLKIPMVENNHWAFCSERVEKETMPGLVTPAVVDEINASVEKEDHPFEA